MAKREDEREIAEELELEHGVWAIEFCGTEIGKAQAAGDDAAVQRWLRITREVTRHLIEDGDDAGASDR
jgi:hypothetical protein